MKLLKAATAVALVCLLTFSMTGCDALEYRDAIDLYNSGNYARAGEMFALLGDFEDSAQLETLCRYWIAVDTMEAGSYDAAIPLLEAMNGYEDCEARITECHYQLALQSFELGDFAAAESYFLQLPDYRQAPEYLRQINWQKFFDAVVQAPLQAERDGKTFALTANPNTNQLVFSVASQADKGYTFRDNLILSLSRDSFIAEITATDSFAMAFGNDTIGSQQAMSGRVDITTCTAETLPVIDAFEKTVTDNQGNTTSSTDLADSLMTEGMLLNFRALMTVIPEMLTEAGMELTLHDIGFAAM